MFFFFFFNDTATTEIYTLSLHDALPIYFHDEFHRGWWTTFLVLHLSRSSPDELCASHCSGERQRSHAETDRTSASRIEQTSTRSVDHGAATSNKSCRNSRGNSRLGSAGHEPAT